MTKTPAKASVYQTVTESILAQLEQGVAPWAKPWKVDGKGQKVAPFSGFPMNFSTGKQYRGINLAILPSVTMAQGWDHPAFASFKQIAAMGGTVKKGSKSTVIFYKSMTERDPRTPEEAAKANENGKVEYWLDRAFPVFNIAQTEGIELEGLPVATTTTLPADTAELVAALQADVRHGGDQAFYLPAYDRVQMPNPEAFEQADFYRSTLYHELAHWTGADHRLKRELSMEKASYAEEELVAELSAAFVCLEYGIETQLRHAEYIGHWIKVLKNDERAFFRAASKAQKVLDFIRERALAAPAQMQAAA